MHPSVARAHFNNCRLNPYRISDNPGTILDKVGSIPAGPATVIAPSSPTSSSTSSQEQNTQLGSEWTLHSQLLSESDEDDIEEPSISTSTPAYPLPPNSALFRPVLVEERYPQIAIHGYIGMIICLQCAIMIPFDRLVGHCAHAKHTRIPDDVLRSISLEIKRLNISDIDIEYFLSDRVHLGPLSFLADPKEGFKCLICFAISRSKDAFRKHHLRNHGKDEERKSEKILYQEYLCGNNPTYFEVSATRIQMPTSHLSIPGFEETLHSWVNPNRYVFVFTIYSSDYLVRLYVKVPRTTPKTCWKG